jgi:hypothetical protein
LKWFRLAAKNGDALAIEVLGKLEKAASPVK